MSDSTRRSLLDVDSAEYEQIPISDRLRWLKDTVTNLVRGGTYLIAGEPGIGKSTLALQIALDLALQGSPSVYLLTEQSVSELKNRATLLLSDLNLEKKRERWNMFG